MFDINDLTITSLETIDAFKVGASGDYLFTLDELQNTTIANAQETTDITGKGGRLLNRLKRNKSVTISGTNGLISGGLLATQVGGEFKNEATEVMWTDYITASADDSATTTYKAIGTSGAEIIHLYKKAADGTIAMEFTQDSTASASGKFAYSNKALTFYTGGDPAVHDVKKDDELVVIYKRKITADVLNNESDKYSGKCALYINAIGEDKCANVYRIQFYIPKADFNGEFDITLGDDQAVHAFEASSLAGACGLSGDTLWTYTVFGENAADANS